MTIQQQAFYSSPHPDGGQITIYQIYDDRNSADPTRWRVKQIRVANTTPAVFYAYAQDPATGQYFPVMAPLPDVRANQRVEPGQDVTWDVPQSYQNRSVDEFNWGAGPV